MKPGGGSHKGSSFERDTCVKLSLWVSRGRNKDLFWRTAMSGGRATVHKRQGSVIRQSGDICSVAPEGHPFTNKYYVECKHIKKLQIGEFMFKLTGPLARFWAIALTEAQDSGKVPMIIAKQNLFPTLILVPRGELVKPAVTCWGVFGCDIGLFDEFLRTSPPAELTAGFPPIERKRLSLPCTEDG